MIIFAFIFVIIFIAIKEKMSDTGKKILCAILAVGVLGIFIHLEVKKNAQEKERQQVYEQEQLQKKKEEEKTAEKNKKEVKDLEKKDEYLLINKIKFDKMKYKQQEEMLFIAAYWDYCDEDFKQKYKNQMKDEFDELENRYKEKFKEDGYVKDYPVQSHH